MAQVTYGTTVTGTGGVTSLASSADWTVGYEWYVWDNTTDRALDRRQQGQITVGTTPTTNTQIRIYAVGVEDGTTYPSPFDGTPSAETIPSPGVRDGFAKLAAVLSVDSTTSDRVYPFNFGLAALFGGMVPAKGVIFVAHNTGAALNATAGNHTYIDRPVT